MKTLRGAVRFIGRVLGAVIFAAGATLLASWLFMYLLISLGGEPVLDSAVGGTLAGVAMVVMFGSLLWSARDGL